MLRFFLAVGFAPALAERAVADYEREFVQRCPPAPFPGIEAMLQRLRDEGLVSAW